MSMVAPIASSGGGELLEEGGKPRFRGGRRLSIEPEAIGQKEEDGRPSEPEGISQSVGVAITLVLLVAGCAIWWLQFHRPLELDLSSIGKISLTLKGWHGEEIPLSDGVEKMLRADSKVQRRYENLDSDLVWLYVGYYGTERGGRPEHTPWVCYPSAGWVILSAIERPPGGASTDGTDARLNEFVVERDGARRLVHFWYQTHRTASIAGETMLTIDHVLGRLSPTGRADGALVRLSTPIEGGGIESARQRLHDFAAALAPNLRENWPQ
jgi:EpsI family protein